MFSFFYNIWDNTYYFWIINKKNQSPFWISVLAVLQLFQQLGVMFLHQSYIFLFVSIWQVMRISRCKDKQMSPFSQLGNIEPRISWVERTMFITKLELIVFDWSFWFWLYFIFLNFWRCYSSIFLPIIHIPFLFNLSWPFIHQVSAYFEVHFLVLLLIIIELFDDFGGIKVHCPLVIFSQL